MRRASPFLTAVRTLSGVQGIIMRRRSGFGAPSVCPTASLHAIRLLDSSPLSELPRYPGLSWERGHPGRILGLASRVICRWSQIFTSFPNSVTNSVWEHWWSRNPASRQGPSKIIDGRSLPVRTRAYCFSWGESFCSSVIKTSMSGRSLMSWTSMKRMIPSLSITNSARSVMPVDRRMPYF